MAFFCDIDRAVKAASFTGSRLYVSCPRCTLSTKAVSTSFTRDSVVSLTAGEVELADESDTFEPCGAEEAGTLGDGSGVGKSD
jgi:hypothetical protein